MAVEHGTGWRLVSDRELADFLRRYPRPVTAEPPLTRKARFRRFLDPTLGSWPSSEVATAHQSHGSTVNTVRTDMISPVDDTRSSGSEANQARPLHPPTIVPTIPSIASTMMPLSVDDPSDKEAGNESENDPRRP